MGPHPANLTNHTAQGSGCCSEECNELTQPQFVLVGQGDEDIADISESCDPNSLDLMERLDFKESGSWSQSMSGRCAIYEFNLKSGPS